MSDPKIKFELGSVLRNRPARPARDRSFDALDIVVVVALASVHTMRFTKPTWVMHRGITGSFLPCLFTDTASTR